MVKRVAVLAVLAVLATACAASNQHLETRVDNLTTELDKMRRELDELRNKYSSDLRIVYRNMIVHPQVATAGALAACAAAKQGQFDAIDSALWEKGFATRTFDAQKSGSDPCWTTPEGCTVVLGYARDANLKLDRFKADMRSCQTDAQVDMRELVGFGIGSTPSFFINGRYMVGAAPIETFEALIDEELAKANQRIQAGTPKAAYYKTWVLGKGLTKLDSPAAAPPGNGS